MHLLVLTRVFIYHNVWNKICVQYASMSILKYHIIGDFCLQTSMGAKWVWCCIRVGHYFAKDLFRQAVNIYKCILSVAWAKGNHWGSSVWVSTKWVNYWSHILDFVRYLRGKGGRDYNEAVHRIQGSLWLSLGGRNCIIFLLSLGSSWNGKSNKSV